MGIQTAMAQGRTVMNTSLIRNSTPLGPYCRTMPRALWWSQGRGLFLMSEVPMYGTHQTFKAGFLPRLSGKRPEKVLSCSLFARIAGREMVASETRNLKGDDR